MQTQARSSLFEAAGPVSVTQLSGLRLCLEALATTNTVPDSELFRLHDRLAMLGVLQALDTSIRRASHVCKCTKAILCGNQMIDLERLRDQDRVL